MATPSPAPREGAVQAPAVSLFMRKCACEDGHPCNVSGPVSFRVWTKDPGVDRNIRNRCTCGHVCKRPTPRPIRTIVSDQGGVHAGQPAGPSLTGAVPKQRGGPPAPTPSEGPLPGPPRQGTPLLATNAKPNSIAWKLLHAQSAAQVSQIKTEEELRGFFSKGLYYKLTKPLTRADPGIQGVSMQQWSGFVDFVIEDRLDHLIWMAMAPDLKWYGELLPIHMPNSLRIEYLRTAWQNMLVVDATKEARWSDIALLPEPTPLSESHLSGQVRVVVDRFARVVSSCETTLQTLSASTLDIVQQYKVSLDSVSDSFRQLVLSLDSTVRSKVMAVTVAMERATNKTDVTLGGLVEGAGPVLVPQLPQFGTPQRQAPSEAGASAVSGLSQSVSVAGRSTASSEQDEVDRVRRQFQGQRPKK